jgi:hypothetical protein
MSVRLSVCILFNAVSCQDYIASVMNERVCSRGGVKLTGTSLSGVTLSTGSQTSIGL